VAKRKHGERSSFGPNSSGGSGSGREGERSPFEKDLDDLNLEA